MQNIRRFLGLVSLVSVVFGASGPAAVGPVAVPKIHRTIGEWLQQRKGGAALRIIPKAGRHASVGAGMNGEVFKGKYLGIDGDYHDVAIKLVTQDPTKEVKAHEEVQHIPSVISMIPVSKPRRGNRTVWWKSSVISKVEYDLAQNGTPVTRILGNLGTTSLAESAVVSQVGFIFQELADCDLLGWMLYTCWKHDDPTGELLIMATDVATCYIPLHRDQYGNSYVHVDGKSGNFVLVKDENSPTGYTPKLTDLDYLKPVNDKTKLIDVCFEGSRSENMAPELGKPDKDGMVHAQCTTAADIYSLGYTLSQMLRIAGDKFPEDKAMPASIAAALDVIAKMCLEKEPTHRPSAPQAHAMLLSLQQAWQSRNQPDLRTLSLEDMNLDGSTSLETKLRDLQADWQMQHEARVFRATAADSDSAERTEIRNGTEVRYLKPTKAHQHLAGAKGKAARRHSRLPKFCLQSPSISPTNSAANTPNLEHKFDVEKMTAEQYARVLDQKASMCGPGGVKQVLLLILEI